MAQHTFNNTKINVEFDESTSRQQLNSGENISTLFGKIKKIFSDLKSVCFSGSYNDLSDTPTTATKDTDGLMSAEDKTKLDSADDTYALKSKYGDTTINVGRKADSTVGAYSTAEGMNTTASGSESHAEGLLTTASGKDAHAEGQCTTASGFCSHAEGSATKANGSNSHAEGGHTKANGDYSHAEGFGTIANNSAEFACGEFNISSSDTLFSIGDGTSDSARHNAFEITTTGGKLHDKDIATTDLIPSSLPANGGNADTVGGLHANDFTQIIDFGYTETDTKTAIGQSGKTTIYRCTNWTDYPAEFIDSQGVIITVNYNGSGTVETGFIWCTQIIVNPRSGNKMFIRYIDSTYISDWKEISTTPIKSTGWITTPTNDYGDIYLAESDSRKYLSVCSQGSFSYMYHTGSDYVVQIRDGNMGKVLSTPVTYNAFYID